MNELKIINQGLDSEPLRGQPWPSRPEAWLRACVIRRGSGAVGGIAASGGTAPTAPNLFNVLDLSLVHGAVHEASRALGLSSWRIS